MYSCKQWHLYWPTQTLDETLAGGSWPEKHWKTPATKRWQHTTVTTPSRPHILCRKWWGTSGKKKKKKKKSQHRQFSVKRETIVFCCILHVLKCRHFVMMPSTNSTLATQDITTVLNVQRWHRTSTKCTGMKTTLVQWGWSTVSPPAPVE